jgi:hypothetical protein
MKYYPIDEKLAKQAKEMNSFSSYKDGRETESYKNAVDCAYLDADCVAEDHPGLSEKAYGLADRYAKKLAEWINKANSIECRCPSVMISGPANFPVAKKEKQNKAREKHWGELTKIKELLYKISNLPRSSSIIRTDDPHAKEKIQAELAKITDEQLFAKEANKYYKANKTLDDIQLLYTCSRISKELLQKFKEYIVYAGVPAPTFYLASLRKKIKRLESKVIEIDRISEEHSSYPVQNICRIIENQELMRIQLEFDGKPSEDIRSLLKQNGFKWSPKNQVWQRQLTLNAKSATRQLLYDLIERQS